MTINALDKYNDFLKKVEDKAFLKRALRHSSLGDNNYERLEFLGDRVLSLVIAEALFHLFPKEAEGDLAKRHTALVQGSVLTEMARRLNLEALIEMSDSEKAAGGLENDNILGDVMEAIIAAYYFEYGLADTATFIKEVWGDTLYEMTEPPQDAKTALQEWTQGKGLGLPTYIVTGQEGPDHAPIFTVQLDVEGFPSVQKKGASKRQAQKEAASEMLAIVMKDKG